MELFIKAFYWLQESANWTGEYGIPHRLLEHMYYTFLVILGAFVIAVPLGLAIGHTRKMTWIISVIVSLRALPTLGILTFLVLLMGNGLWPPIITLIMLAIPPLLAATYTGIQAINPETVDASRALGMTEWQLLKKVEIPLAFPVIFGGFRSAFLQVIATATVAAYINLGGLGRFLIDGLALGNYSQMLAGAMIIALLAIVCDEILEKLEQYIQKCFLTTVGVS